jgi:hypothetical protein
MKPAHFKLSQNKDQEEMTAIFYKSLRDKAFGEAIEHCNIAVGATMCGCITPTNIARIKNKKQNISKKYPKLSQLTF